MAQLTQANRPIAITTTLGTDNLLLEKISGSEGLSRPFRFDLQMLSQPGFTFTFDQLLGQKVSVQLDVGDAVMRYFHGIVMKLSEGPEVPSPDNQGVFRRYFAQIVPQFFLLNRTVRSRVFQHLSVPDILSAVLGSVTFSSETQGTYEKRDYCVQYRESDFQFASRLMEEEGIYYFFRHTSSDHTLVMADSPTSNADLPGNKTVVFNDFSGLRDARVHEDRIVDWQKTQEIRSGAYTLWDYSFEMPAKNLEAKATIQATSTAGTVTHQLGVGGNDQMEIYNYPGEYAQRFDGVDSGGGDQASELSKIEQDNARTVKIRMQQEASGSLKVSGMGNVRRFIPGYKFTLDQHPSGNGDYVLTDISMSATIAGTYTSNETVNLKYQNKFDCVPSDLPYFPARTIPKPTVRGSQTAVVVGSDGAEISTDKYGRVKVQFFWDRLGTKNLDSSCWIRVSQPWAGKNWGAFFLPRVGQEVVVDFLEGDPDQPIITGSVYNSDQIVPYTLPDNKTVSTIKTRSSEKGTADNFNELRFEDKKDSEEIYFHAEKDFNRVVENNDTLKVGFDKTDKGDQTIEIYNDRTERLQEGNEKVTIEKGNRTITVSQGNDEHTVHNNRTVTVEQGDDKHQVKTGKRTVLVDTGDDEHTIATGNRTVTVSTGNDTHEVKTGNRSVSVDLGNDATEVKVGNHSLKVDAGASAVQAMQSIKLTVGPSSIEITPQGITIKGLMISVQGTAKTEVTGAMTTVSGSAMTQVSGGIIMIG